MDIVRLNVGLVKIRVNMFRSIKVKIGETEVNVMEAGKGERSMVMVHGWTNNWVGLRPIAKILAKKFRVILVDLPGWGDSDRLKKYDLATEAKYLRKIIKKLNLKKPWLLGHSMGTYVVAKSYCDKPESVSGLILVGPVMRGRGRRVVKKFFSGIDKYSGLIGLTKKIIDTRYYSYWTSRFINMYKYDQKIVERYGLVGKRKMDGRAYVEMGKDLAETRIEELIVNNKAPIMLLFGKQDKITNRTRAEKILKGRGNYEFREIDQAGHLVTVEKPKETAREVEEWVEKIRRARPAAAGLQTTGDKIGG